MDLVPPRAVLGLLLLLWAGACVLEAQAAEKLDSCDLVDPKIEEHILKQTSLFATQGIRDEVIRSLHEPCINETAKHPCIKAQKFLIKDGVVYVTNLMPVNGFGYVELIGFLVELYEVSQVYKLPDVEFAYWHDDNPPAETVLRPTAENPTASAWPFPPHDAPPVLAWATFPGNAALVVPYSGAFRCPKDSFDSLLEQVPHMNANPPWEQREKLGFGRWNIFCAWYYGNHHVKTADGQPVPCPRDYINNLYYNHTDKLLTVALNRPLAGSGKPAQQVPLLEQNKYRYIVSTDGELDYVHPKRLRWSISSKFDKYLLLGSLVLKAEGFVYGWYYPAMKAWEHYVPFMVKDKDDVLEMIDWARSHDEEAHKIAQAGQSFALKHLARKTRLCYIYKLIKELAKHMKYTPDCSKRPVCVPLVEEIKFLKSFDVTHAHCRYDEVLGPYAAADPAARTPEFLKDLTAQHQAVPHHLWGGRRHLLGSSSGSSSSGSSSGRQ
ncbi:hypothetical protein CHLRE_03g203550v5 [Chlamydomonas reinhardtii]|uniref:Glycosyl transferase CAP10 domain-containing protein n=1 Tax=Chlamydomonas reinhardtii TaxID=3055 RepID=A0A2K3DZ64_CHLRE|nr:uncharacterized protein CHLRE_03g203550v5 [Chlamydomonas reinhardtii]PNW85832.1 hypothetical protein CHLRE_03g203550v5 [Chlamydomonas reinhardtii]